MINMIVGSIGSGKSYEAVVYHVIPALQEGRKIKTNLPLNIEFLKTVYDNVEQLIEVVVPTTLNPVPFQSIDDYKDDWRHPENNQGVLFIIDECHKALFKGRTNQQVEEYYAESRHAGHDHLLITQSSRKVSANIVDMVQLIYRVRKNTALGSANSYVRKVQDGNRGEVVNTTVRKYQAKYFKYYQSHTQSNKSVMEANAKDIKPIWQHWTVYMFALLLIPISYMVFSGKLNLFKNGNLAHAAEAKTISIPAAPQPKYMQVLSVKSPEPSIAPEPKQQLPSDNIHPYYKVSLHVGGVVFNQAKELILFYASQNMQHVFTLTNDELTKAGYKITLLSECSVHISYQETGYDDYITCNNPSQAIASPVG